MEVMMSKNIALVFFCIFSGLANAMSVERNFAYESMIEYREESRNLLYGRKGIVNVPSALLREKHFLAGNKSILEKIKQLEDGIEESKYPSERLVDFGIRELISAIKGNLTHIDENGEQMSFSLKDKLDTVTEIVIAYNSLRDGTHSYNDRIRLLLPLWQRVETLLAKSIESRE